LIPHATDAPQTRQIRNSATVAPNAIGTLGLCDDGIDSRVGRENPTLILLVIWSVFRNAGCKASILLLS
jgi:hypothetical protein